MKRIIIFVIALNVFTASAFQTRPSNGTDALIRKLKTLALVVENRTSTISQSEWRDLDSEYVQLGTQIRKLERSFSQSQHEEIKEWRSRYYCRRVKSKVAHSIRTGIYNAQQFMLEVCESVR